MKRKSRRALSIFMLFSCLLVAACSSPPKTTAAVTAPLIPMPKPAPVIDPDDGKLIQAIDGYIGDNGGPAFSRYEFTRIDLDNDGRREGLVMMNAPFRSWCNGDGCAMLVFKARNEGFSLQSEIAPVRGPLMVSNAATNGWRDLVIKLTGREEAPRDVALRFNGATYPATPESQPSVYAQNAAAGIVIFP